MYTSILCAHVQSISLFSFLLPTICLIKLKDLISIIKLKKDYLAFVDYRFVWFCVLPSITTFTGKGLNLHYQSQQK